MNVEQNLPRKYHCGMKKTDVVSRYKNSVGMRLKIARTNAGLTQTEAAEALSVKGIKGQRDEYINYSSIGNWERGVRFPENPLIINTLAKIYKVSPSWILGYKEAASNEDEKELLELFRETDQRGRDFIMVMAKSQQKHSD